MLGKIKLLSQNSAKPSGINDKKEIVSITPLAKSKEEGSVDSRFLENYRGWKEWGNTHLISFISW